VPVFEPRTRVQILRGMVARVVARSRLVGLTRNSAVFHILAAAATEDAEQYFQMSRLRSVFSIDKATGSDLDERATEIAPGIISRRSALFASGDVVYSRPGTTGVVAIPIGSIVAASDSEGQIKYRTTEAGEISDGNSTSDPINVTAVEAGIRANVAETEISQIVTRIPGVTGVSNAALFSNGRDRESDSSFRSRLKAHVQSLSRGTPTAIEGFAKQVILADGRRVVFAHLREPAVPNGVVTLYIDDGTGSVEEYSEEFFISPETLLDPAVGGETEFFTFEKPIRDDGSFVLEVNDVALVRGVDYLLNPAEGHVVLDETAYPAGLTVGDKVEATYRHYLGLIQETQRVVDGDPADAVAVPGVRPAGVTVLVQAPQVLLQSIDANISVLTDYDPTAVALEVRSVIQAYINGLDIGDDVIVSELIEQAMGVDGMFDFTINTLTGGAPANQVVLDTQVARIVGASITLT
jgi:uncharacterized phage protein gp47/JayE